MVCLASLCGLIVICCAYFVYLLGCCVYDYCVAPCVICTCIFVRVLCCLMCLCGCFAIHDVMLYGLCFVLGFVLCVRVLFFFLKIGLNVFDSELLCCCVCECVPCLC